MELDFLSVTGLSFGLDSGLIGNSPAAYSSSFWCSSRLSSKKVLLGHDCQVDESSESISYFF